MFLFYSLRLEKLATEFEIYPISLMYPAIIADILRELEQVFD